MRNSPKPDDPNHAKMLDDCDRWFLANGFRSHPFGYHDILPEGLKDELQAVEDPTSLSARTRADRIVIRHTPAPPASFYLECKTITEDNKNLAVEALPLLVHIAEAVLFDVRCLYVVADFTPDRLFRGGFLVSRGLLDHLTLFTTNRFAATLNTILTHGYKGCQDIVQLGRTRNGSNDPFVRIRRDDFPRVFTTNWGGLIAAATAPNQPAPANNNLPTE